LHIVGEYFLPIHFQLMVLPGVQLEEIRSVHSHIHALGQCRNVVRRHGWTPVIAGDTAGAARVVRDEQDRTKAAFAPRLAAELYGLDILMEDVEDTENNVTRFVVLSKNEAWAERKAADQLMVSTFIFQVRNVPAALYKALGGFATNSVNMTKLESYQLEGRFVSTLFYADVEGHPNDRNVALALEEIAFFSKEMRILGVYDAHPFRINQSASV
ncbi:MAG TPA: prephenate dehydratase domain-containing protein, partial [Tianweitania sediminis]|nr:prephenate dehydratase domain-containing protein [Tianweitania sediminis]